MRKQMIVIAVGIILVLALATIAIAADPHDGTWKVNVAKSKYNPGPAPKSLTTKRETVGNSAKTVFDGVDADGKTIHYEYTATFDGKDCPITGSPNFDAISLKRIDADTFEWVTKKSGKEVDARSHRLLQRRQNKNSNRKEQGRKRTGIYINRCL